VPYDPSQLPIGERIVLNVVSTLQAVAPPTYATSVREVRRFDGNAFHTHKLPAIAVVEGVEEHDNQRLAIIEHVLPLNLVLAVHGQDWQVQLKKLAADIRVAILADHTRGGLSMDTRVSSTEVFDSEPSSPLGVAQIDVRIRYRTAYHNPGSTTP